MPAKRIILGVSFLLVASGFLLPFWPLSLVGIALAAGMGSWFAAILFGLLLDIAYGVPAGAFHFLYFPFALFAILCALGRVAFFRYVRKGEQNTL